MQQHGIKAKTKRKFVVTTDSCRSLPVAPDLVQRRFNPGVPNQLWSGDNTSIQTILRCFFMKPLEVCPTSGGQFKPGAVQPAPPQERPRINQTSYSQLPVLRKGGLSAHLND